MFVLTPIKHRMVVFQMTRPCGVSLYRISVLYHLCQGHRDRGGYVVRTHFGSCEGGYISNQYFSPLCCISLISCYHCNMSDKITIPKAEYERLHKIEKRYETIRKIILPDSEETDIDQTITQGESELRDGKTIIASSSDEALKQYNASSASYS